MSTSCNEFLDVKKRPWKPLIYFFFWKITLLWTSLQRDLRKNLIIFSHPKTFVDLILFHFDPFPSSLNKNFDNTQILYNKRTCKIDVLSRDEKLFHRSALVVNFCGFKDKGEGKKGQSLHKFTKCVREKTIFPTQFHCLETGKTTHFLNKRKMKNLDVAEKCRFLWFWNYSTLIPKLFPLWKDRKFNSRSSPNFS